MLCVIDSKTHTVFLHSTSLIQGCILKIYGILPSIRGKLVVIVKFNHSCSYGHQDFPGGSVVKTPCFHCRGHGFNPWSGNFRMLRGVAKKKKK